MKRKSGFCLLVSLFFIIIVTACSFCPVFSEEKMNLIVKFKSEVPETRQQELLTFLNLKVNKKLELIGALVCQHEGKVSLEEVIEKGKEFTEVEYIEPDYEVKTQ